MDIGETRECRKYGSSRRKSPVRGWEKEDENSSTATTVLALLPVFPRRASCDVMDRVCDTSHRD